MPIALLDRDRSFGLGPLFEFEDLGLLVFGKLLHPLRPLQLLKREPTHDRALHFAHLRFVRDDENEVVPQRPQSVSVRSFALEHAARRVRGSREDRRRFPAHHETEGRVAACRRKRRLERPTARRGTG